MRSPLSSSCRLFVITQSTELNHLAELALRAVVGESHRDDRQVHRVLGENSLRNAAQLQPLVEPGLSDHPLGGPMLSFENHLVDPALSESVVIGQRRSRRQELAAE